MDSDAVRVRNLRKTYGGAAVVDDVSFEIARGETFALLGPNGAGKSTTVEILEGYRRRTGGDVSVLGADPGTASLEWKARIGIVLQSAGQAGVYTVREQLRQFALYYPRPRDVDEVIAAVGLEQQAGTRIAKLSGGQQRRVDVALGIIGRPELLFLDEPTTGFDPQARREFWELIRRLQSEGTTILLTTHYLDEAAQLADRVAVITRGRLQAIGPVATFGGEEARTPRVVWREAGVVREERTATPWEFTAALAARLGGEPEGLEIRRPALEEIYLGMVDESEPEPEPDPEAAPDRGIVGAAVIDEEVGR
ncbi:ABC transporter ATP-binding protein [Microbacterium sp. zg.Y625]|uniref:ABC transporter ATP-binding protein n=1 Tax=Microbacterium jiangjiandongii TaxID=3049071 RepID=UPI00214D0D64|nr:MULTISPECIES: ABC transporter ATP-binding protein [unclassified Microbacterium]MCR2791981.1 ABC transporter ATP-binding protein [Microbacterium sp. zg.Y625]WIM24789.1 ABC transporter ATP-binding protein [Microbacterium sp. zg-Y625]